MNKTIASLAILASTSSAFALIGPGGTPRPEPRTYCLNLSQDEAGVSYVGDCDLKEINRRSKAEIKENGCAEGQAAMQTLRVVVPACPTFVQL